MNKNGSEEGTGQMEPGGAAEKWRNHGHGRHFPGNLYAVCDRPSSGPSFDCRHWIDGNCLSPKGKISGTCGSESGDLRVLTVFHDSAGHISRSRRPQREGDLARDGWTPDRRKFQKKKGQERKRPGERTKRRRWRRQRRRSETWRSIFRFRKQSFPDSCCFWGPMKMM